MSRGEACTDGGIGARVVVVLADKGREPIPHRVQAAPTSLLLLEYF